MQNLLVTGYAAHELGIYSQKHKALKYIRKACINKMIPLIEEGVEWIITPGQYGFDLWAAEMAIQIREQMFPQLKVSIIHAYANQEQGWNEDKQQYWNKIKAKLDHYAVVSKQPYSGPWQFQARDTLLLNKTDGMLLFYDEESSASKARFIKEKAIKKAENVDYPLYTITADDINVIIEEEALQMMDYES
ncbi:UPF0398 protein YpsA [Paenibacillus montaniterrae]|uniref:UPF0398 protein YpsA n=1 Tax=Paenibacillus montaniterrae TaxID=429341 RepID=A0A919YL91_9BACL|nr:SLOG family protein [Paenibacillus montaniterrae]GIP15540.1 UPF0398 protein YpsA [Paenibacillus montaniterrae]